MTNHELVTYLQNKNACRPAMEWLKDRDLERMWEECERGDWLLWFAAKVGIDRKVIVRTACACAREALRFVPFSGRGRFGLVRTSKSSASPKVMRLSWLSCSIVARVSGSTRMVICSFFGFGMCADGARTKTACQSKMHAKCIDSASGARYTSGNRRKR